MASKSRRITNVNGAASGPLKTVAYVDSSKSFVSNAVKNAPPQYKTVVNDILLAVKQFISDSDQHQLMLDAKLTDVMLGRIASLLDEIKDSFASTELQEMKKEILDQISGESLEGVFKNFLLSQINEIFDNDAKKEDIEELKGWMLSNINVQASSQPVKQEDSQQNYIAIEEEEKGDFKSSTPASNFYALQTFIQSQFDTLNKNLKNVPGQSGILTRLNKSLNAGLEGVLGKVSSLSKNVQKGMSNTFNNIKKLGSNIGGAIASPFKKIGGFFSSLNPFNSSANKKEKKKQALKDRMLQSISKLIGKAYRFIEPFIKKVRAHMLRMLLSVIVPIAIIMAKVLLIVAAIVLIGIALYFVYNKIMQFLEYVKSGQMWEDIKAKLLAAWGWLKDFGGFIWDQLIKIGKMIPNWCVDALKFLYVDIPVWIWEKLCDFGEWLWDKLCEFGDYIWDKLCEFGDWLYSTYIEKYVIKPLMSLLEPLAKIWDQKIWPKIEPFVKSITNLKDRIVKAFSAWDSNKSIWENLKNISGIIKDSVLEWWNESPFKAFYENHLKKFVDSITNLRNRIVKAFSAWDSNKSIWENLKNISGIIKDSVLEWWNESPFKAFYEKYLEPFVSSAKELFTRLSDLGGYIKNAILDWWNGDSSLGDTLKNIGSIVWDTVVDWWKGSVFKEYWEKLKNYLNDLLKPLKEWYETSSLKKWIDKVIDFAKAIKDSIVEWWNNSDVKQWIDKISAKVKEMFNKAGNVIWDFPGVPLLRPFGFLVGKPVFLSKEEKQEYKEQEKLREQQEKLNKKISDIANDRKKLDGEIAKLEAKLKSGNYNKTGSWFGGATKEQIEKDIAKKKAQQYSLEQQSASLAAQQVQQASKPIKQIESMQQSNQTELQKTGAEMSQKVEKTEKQNADFQKQQREFEKQCMSQFNYLGQQITDFGKDPYVITSPVPYGPQRNAAAMETN